MVQSKSPREPKPPREGLYARLNVYVAIIGVLVTIVGVVIAYLALASAAHWSPFRSSSSPSPMPSPPTSSAPTSTPQTLTVDQVRNALLTTSDLAGIDQNLTVLEDVEQQNSYCWAPAVKPTIDLLREFGQDDKIGLAEEIEIYSSSVEAHTAFGEEAPKLTCEFSQSYPISDISSGISGTCSESAAWSGDTITDGTNYSSYDGIVRCNRAIVFFAALAPQGTSFDHEEYFIAGMSAAASKVEQLS